MKKPHWISTKGAHTGLLGCEAVANHTTVYLCEGEWDTIAMRWLLQKVGAPGAVVGVPGASVFKKDWPQFFLEKDVICLYDSDEAGDNGELLAQRFLSGISRSLRYVHWPAEVPGGFDVRDWIKYGAVQKGNPGACYDRLHVLLREAPRSKRSLQVQSGLEKGQVASAPKVPPIGHREAEEMYRVWLKIDDPVPLRIIFGTIFANRMDGDPIWTFVVGPPGSAKSETLLSLADCQEVEMTTSLTPHTLISGAQLPGGGDPSLLPRLNNKVLVIKDFTTILAMNEAARDEIFGTLRDAYDGVTEKIFGNGLRRKYHVKFGIVSGVTPAIDSYGSMHQSLGERFLKLRVGGDRKNESEIITKAVSNVGREVKMRDDLRKIAVRILAKTPMLKPGAHGEPPKDLPTVSPEMVQKIVALARFCAIMRGTVDRERYSQVVNYQPTYEWGTRLGKQLMKLAMGVAVYLGHPAVGAEEYRTLLVVARDTCPDRAHALVRELWFSNPNGLDGETTYDLAVRSRLPDQTVHKVMQDLSLLGVVDRRGSGRRYVWCLSKHMVELISKGDVYGYRQGLAGNA
jgi:hypothetical protein